MEAAGSFTGARERLLLPGHAGLPFHVRLNLKSLSQLPILDLLALVGPTGVHCGYPYRSRACARQPGVQPQPWRLPAPPVLTRRQDPPLTVPRRGHFADGGTTVDALPILLLQVSIALPAFLISGVHPSPPSPALLHLAAFAAASAALGAWRWRSAGSGAASTYVRSLNLTSLLLRLASHCCRSAWVPATEG